MPELLVELICEPLPRWAQSGEAPKELARRLCAGLKEKGLLSEGETEPSIFATPLRLAFRIPGVAEHAPERTEERRGPRVDAPSKAVMGFMRSAGLTNIEDLKPRESKDGKGKFWFADIKVESQPAEALIPEIIIEAMRQLPWQKTMRWEANGFRWPRALYRYLVLLDDKPLSLASVAASLPESIEGGKAETLDTYGNPVPVSSPKDWQRQLKSRGITLIFEERREDIYGGYFNYSTNTSRAVISRGVASLGGVLSVFASMTEAPRVVKVSLDGSLADNKMLNRFVSQVLEGELRSVFCPAMGDEEACLLFVAEAPPPGGQGGAQDPPLKDWATELSLPEGLATWHQDWESRRYLPADWEASLQDAVRRVAYARFADAKFYWERDKATGLAKLHESLKDMRYHLRLGSLHERSERLAQLSRFVVQQSRSVVKELGAENREEVEDYVEIAGRYVQTDLASETVREFPKLAGDVSGTLYFYEKYLHEDAPADNKKRPLVLGVLVAMMVYRDKQHPADLPPKFTITFFLRVVENTDALVGLWAAGERATGSGDPFAMRRHALYLSTVLMQDLFKDFSLHTVIEESARLYRLNQYKEVDFSPQNLKALKEFIFERIKYSMLESTDIPHDILQAAIYSTARQKEGIVFRMRESALALHKLLGQKVGKNLQAAWVRASGLAKGFDPDKKFVATPDSTEEEVILFNALEQVERSIQTEESVKKQIRLLAALRKPIDNFLDNVRVLEGTQAEQENRLALLRQFMDTVRLVADLDYLEGGERAAPPPRASKPPSDSKPSGATPSAPGV